MSFPPCPMTTVASRAPAADDPAGALPYVCPACATPNVVDLVALSRASATACVSCGRLLKVRDVMRARLTPRS